MRFATRTIALGVTLVAAGALTTGVAVGQSPPADLLPIEVRVTAALDQITKFAGVEQGAYEEQGLDANVEILATGPDIISAIGSGDAQIGSLGTVAVFRAIAQGVPLKIIAMNFGDPTVAGGYNEHLAIAARPDVGIVEGDPATLAGKRIGTPLGTDAEAYVRGILSTVGLTADDVELVNTAPADLATALQQGLVDAIGIWEPVITNTLGIVDGSFRVSKGGAPEPYAVGVTVVNSDFLAQQPEAVKRWLTAEAALQQWYRSAPGEAAEVMSRWVPAFTPEVALSAIDAGFKGGKAFDMRLSQAVVDGMRDITVPFLAAQGEFPADFDPTSALSFDLLAEVEAEHPELFADLAPIPEDLVYPAS
jgi:ABC-type nitrate/sulfonate/bicarbonate transport system substrate-binding protein